MRIGLLTGGGDVPGLNVAIKAVVERSAERGWEVLGLRRGWLGLLAVEPASHASRAEWTMPLNPANVRIIDRDGGTILHTSRLEPSKLHKSEAPLSMRAEFGKADTLDATPHAKRAIEALKLDAVIALGGDGTLRFAARLAAEGVNIVSIPKTMDNDVHGTDYAIGFSTAITRSVEAVTALRTTAGSHERIMIVELFGRYSGQTALYAGLLAAADRTLIAEAPFDLARAAALLEQDRLANPSRYAVAVVSEGAKTVDGQLSEKGSAEPSGRRHLGGIGEVLGAACRQASAEGVIVQNLAYLMRSGPPDATDRIIALSFGVMAVEILAAKHGPRMCALKDGNFRGVAIESPLQGPKHLDVAACYDVNEYRARFQEIEGLGLYGV
jgi:6-phosphofructokinase 1